MNAVIFDCDGVLIDSEVLACVVDAEVLTASGFAITAAEVAERYLGRSLDFMLKDIEVRGGWLPPADLGARLQSRLLSAFARELRAVPGMASLAAGLSSPKCVASSSTRARLQMTLGHCGFAEIFGDWVFSAEQVTRGKPAPDLFLLAASKMAVAPKSCLVVEDSPAGIQAAVAAGMRAIGFSGGGHCGPGHAALLRAAGAWRTAASSEELAPLLA